MLGAAGAGKQRWLTCASMRLLSFSTAGQTSFGLVTAAGNGVIDLARRLDGITDLSQLLASGAIDAATAHVGADPDHHIDQVQFERLLPWPRKIFCIGVNYGGRGAEYKDGEGDTGPKSYPSVFVRFPDSFTGHRRPLIRPPESHQLDYEGEIVAVIGKRGRRIPVDQARNHIAGLSIGNEGTIRDWVRHARFNVTQGKNWAASGAIGPWLKTLDEIGDFDDLELTTHVNGELRQQDHPRTMAYSIEYQVHYLSTFTELLPGDVIFTGTPTGAGARFDPPRWLEPGDVVEVSVSGIGTLSNTVQDESELEQP